MHRGHQRRVQRAMEQPSDLLTIKEAAALLKVSPITVTRYVKQERLSAYHIGPRAIRVRRADIEQLLRPTTKREEVATTKEQQTPSSPSMAPLTAEEKARLAQTMEQAKALQARMLQRRGGKPLSPSWKIIEEARRQRAAEL